MLVLDAATVEVLAKSAQSVDYHSQRFTGRKMSSGSGCACSGCRNREEFVRDVWPALWGAFGERWRSKQ